MRTLQEPKYGMIRDHDEHEEGRKPRYSTQRAITHTKMSTCVTLPQRLVQDPNPEKALPMARHPRVRVGRHDVAIPGVVREEPK